MAENVNITIKAFDKTKKGFSSVTSGLKKVTGAIFSMKSALGLAAGAAGMGLLIRQSLKSIDTLKKTADKIGTTTEALSALHHAGDLTGVSLETVNMASQRFTRRLAEAAKGTGEAKGALRELGIDADNLKKKQLDEQMLDLADAFSNVESSADRVRLAMKLFDSEGVALVNTLSKGRDGLKAMFLEADELGLIMSTKAAKGVEDANDALTRLFKLGAGLKNQIVANLAPAIEMLSTKIKDGFLEDIKEAGGSVEEFGLILAEKLLQGLVELMHGFAATLRGLADFGNGLIEMINKVREWMDLAPITAEFTYKFADSISNLAGDIWRAKMGLRALHDEAGDLAGDEKLPNIFEKWGASIKGVAEKMPSLREHMDAVGKSLESSLTKGFTDAITGAKSFGEAMKDVARTVVDALMKMFVQYMIVQPMLNALGGALGIPVSATGKAIGGSVQSGQPYMVGERGPELFVPNSQGSIVSNKNLDSGGGSTIVQNIHVGTSVSSAVRAEMMNLLPYIIKAAQNGVVDSKLRGGQYAKALA